jgi:hypothetical protein
MFVNFFEFVKNDKIMCKIILIFFTSICHFFLNFRLSLKSPPNQGPTLKTKAKIAFNYTNWLPWIKWSVRLGGCFFGIGFKGMRVNILMFRFEGDSLGHHCHHHYYTIIILK